ncbi:MAG: MBL fold metallo-hydrolase [Armatimonadetes bacterium]|nr:MBL fold metallo-hydrolase [Armatimonadota bacterium]
MSTRLVLLGTAGGPTPKANRAPSAYALVVGEETFIIDAGNGVGQQLAKAKIGINSFRNVFLTHQHSDHSADIGTLALLAWATNPTKPITLWGPPPLKAMLRHFQAFQALDIKTRIADEGRPPFESFVGVREITKPSELLSENGVTVRCTLNAHPPLKHSFAYRFDTPDRSFVFSGDTTYSKGVVELAQGADVLVHEIMLPSALEPLIASEPNAKTLREHLHASHSTPEQVGRVATEAGVKTLVLSHFVPGGAPLPDSAWHDAVKPHFSGTIVTGWDLLEL